MRKKLSFIKMLACAVILAVMLLPVGSRQVVYAAMETWDIAAGNLVVSSGGTFTVTGSTTSHTISINTADPVTLTLNNVTIDVSSAGGLTAFDSGGNVTLYLEGSNTLRSSSSQPGLRVTNGERLTVSSASSTGGSLTAVGGAFGAGIGGGYMQNGGAVTILSGVVHATGGDFAAGIGGAYTGSGGVVTISGGTVTATGGVRAAGIGGGIGGSGGDVVITGGSVKAGGVRSNIGAGYNGAHDGTLTNGFVPVVLSTIPNAVAAENPAGVTHQLLVSGTNPDYSYIYTYTGTGHGGGDTNLYFYLPSSLLPAPDAPAGLSASALSASQIRLTWIDSSSDEQGFKIERCAGAGCTNFAQVVMVGANVTSYTNTGLTASTSYSYRMRAYNASGDSSYSDMASAVTQAAPAPPAAPSNLTTTVLSSSQVRLNWTDNANNESGFRIERCRGATCANFALIASMGPNVTSYTSSGLAANTTYRYRVYAFNASGNSGYSNTSAATTRRR